MPSDAAGGVDVGDGQADARDLGRAEEGEVAGQRQDAADAERVGAGLAAAHLSLVKVSAAGDSPSDSLAAGVEESSASGSGSSEPQAAKVSVRAAVPAISLTQVVVRDRFTR